MARALASLKRACGEAVPDPFEQLEEDINTVNDDAKKAAELVQTTITMVHVIAL